MAGRYRALLIGNSTYPVDEHNLQALKGPVKDIAALNRALVDRDTGLFDDVDVTLLPEVTSTRALRSLSRFFGSADRDDVLLLYFSGHGKLDQSGRLHLCMQDTETTDLLSTAVSSTRINEFAESSRARNVVIVLDCCYAGAFRGGDFGDAVAGPGRYVLTSCRSSQLANDATVDNGTSYFTQHVVEGLLGAAADRDRDGYVDFSDLYAYVDRQLRQEGKQVPQRRVTGDGDLRLARRSAAVESDPTGTPAPPAPVSPPEASAPRRSRRRLLVGAGLAGLGLLGIALAAVLLRGGTGGSGGGSGGGPGVIPTRVAATFTATAPWRLRVLDAASIDHDPGCTVALREQGSTSLVPVIDGVYAMETSVQVHQTGRLDVMVNHDGCLVAFQSGSGRLTLPAAVQARSGDSDAFPAPQLVKVTVLDFAGGQRCRFTLNDPSDGQLLDFATATPDADSVTLRPGGARSVYLTLDDCGVRIEAG